MVNGQGSQTIISEFGSHLVLLSLALYQIKLGLVDHYLMNFFTVLIFFFLFKKKSFKKFILW